MTTALSPLDVAPRPSTEPITRRARWPWFGVVAAVTGLVSSWLTIHDLDEEVIAEGVGVLDHLDRGRYHVAFLVGLVSVALLFLTSTAWRRWAEVYAPGDLAARTIGAALAATATVNVVFVGLTGSMALYLPGGSDEGWLHPDAMFVNFTLLDFGQLLGWWGGMVAAGCVAALALRRANVLPRWMGVASIVLMLPAVVMALVTGLPGFPGFVMPLWLIVISVGLVAGRRAGA